MHILIFVSGTMFGAWLYYMYYYSKVKHLKQELKRSISLNDRAQDLVVRYEEWQEHGMDDSIDIDAVNRGWDAAAAGGTINVSTKW